MQRRKGDNNTDGESNKRARSEEESSARELRKRRRAGEIAGDSPALSRSDGASAREKVTLSISILSEPASSPSSVRKAILDIKEIAPFNRSLIISSGCIPPLLQRLGVGIEENDEIILQVIDALCKEDSKFRHHFRTIAFIKKAVALAIPALGDPASLGSTARSARHILTGLSDSSCANYDSDVLQEQEQRLDSLKQDFFLTQTNPYDIRSNHSDGECENCSVCLESLNHDATTSLIATAAPVSFSLCCLPCKHAFHKRCISMWLLKHANCPVCRLKLREPPRTPAILTPAIDLPFPLSFLIGLGGFGLSFGFTPQIVPGGMNVVLVSVRSQNSPRR